ncbi:bacteriophage protein gp37 [Mycobacteroides abscessus subsp. abscessus]|uniref:DUF5131 family protein n=1 Tax=Mycobacteroides abscessus TaxID=36809 RepID=UPI00092B9C61|nr:phage Gp37/Gp68 family protein [Mycobacteroides abscessus]SHX75558.1 bacteriophage protein gp37 [Mycobacteroides abscessus subsp. abscessus]SHY25239.1 bacteriophage protein gp37 [Mycobacteroides abscessus subsp. abscessus]SIC27527.1 bacteriophage protein gp37 [Mycobacteroides abscessus subsp. abscessus]SKV39781.1 bacteriophage protein gp37 [Mycobacteroides abscessus subsp. abscessus]
MGDKTGIEWTDATWNPVTGCTKVGTPGCDHCYAETFAERWRGTKGHYFERGFDVQLRPDKLDLPLRWTKPRKVFVNSMSDLFHDKVSDEYIAQVFAVMALAPQHTFQLLTKRHGRMRSIMTSRDLSGTGAGLSLEAMVRNVVDNRRGAEGRLDWLRGDDISWPLPNVWLGVSAEDQKRADLRIPALLDTPAAVRWISAEPLLGPVNLHTDPIKAGTPFWGSQLDWVVVGGESGSGARPMHPWWAESLHRQCVAAGVPFLFKQWGDWTPMAPLKKGRFDFSGIAMTDDGNTYNAGDLDWPDGPRRGEAMRADFPHHHPTSMYRVGKKAAGRELYHDGRTFDEYPGVVTE